jgi:DNA polymerase V
MMAVWCRDRLKLRPWVLKWEYQPFKKVGILMSELVASDQLQTNLFDERDRERAKKLMQTIDEINLKMGKDAIKFAAEGMEQLWKMRSQYRSPKYTTCWNDLPIVRA